MLKLLILLNTDVLFQEGNIKHLDILLKVFISSWKNCVAVKLRIVIASVQKGNFYSL